MRLDEFSDDAEPTEEQSVKSGSTSVKELEEATKALHKAYLLVDTLLRNMPDSK